MFGGIVRFFGRVGLLGGGVEIRLLKHQIDNHIAGDAQTNEEGKTSQEKTLPKSGLHAEHGSSYRPGSCNCQFGRVSHRFLSVV